MLVPSAHRGYLCAIANQWTTGHTRIIGDDWQLVVAWVCVIPPLKIATMNRVLAQVKVILIGSIPQSMYVLITSPWFKTESSLKNYV